MQQQPSSPSDTSAPTNKPNVEFDCGEWALFYDHRMWALVHVIDVSPVLTTVVKMVLAYDSTDDSITFRHLRPHNLFNSPTRNIYGADHLHISLVNTEQLVKFNAVPAALLSTATTTIHLCILNSIPYVPEEFPPFFRDWARDNVEQQRTHLRSVLASTPKSTARPNTEPPDAPRAEKRAFVRTTQPKNDTPYSTPQKKMKLEQPLSPVPDSPPVSKVAK